MKKVKLYLAFVFLMSLIISSCSKDKSDTITQTFEMDAIKGIELSIAANINILKGDTQKVEITGPEQTVNEIIKEVNSGIWDIHLPSFYNKRYENLEITITSNIIEEIEISGSGDIVATDTLPLSNISISGSGNINVTTISTTLNSNISGSGNISIEGTTNQLNYDNSGSGNFEGFGLETTNAEISISGSGDTEVFANTKLVVSISGSGSVYYKGSPSLTQNITGSGSIVDAN